MEKYTLLNPVGEIKELSFDFDSLTTGDLRQISKLESMIRDTMSACVKDLSQPKKLSFEFHLATGFLAAVKGTSGLNIIDFTRISMRDALAIEEKGSFFCMNAL